MLLTRRPPRSTRLARHHAYACPASVGDGAGMGGPHLDGAILDDDAGTKGTHDIHEIPIAHTVQEG